MRCKGIKRTLWLLSVFSIFSIMLTTPVWPAGALDADGVLTVNNCAIKYTMASGEVSITPTQAEWTKIDAGIPASGLAITTVSGLPNDAHSFTVRCDDFWFDKSGKRRRADLSGYGSVLFTDRLFEEITLNSGKVDIVINLFTLAITARQNGEAISCAQNGSSIPYVLNTAVTYTAREGDSLSTIAPRYGTTWQQLAMQNPQIGNPDIIDAGQVIDVDYKPTDYSIADNWLNLPSRDKSVDVFYVYPTVYTADKNEPLMADIDSLTMHEAASGVYAEQAAVFADAGNIYAPYYRQISTNYLADLDGDGMARLLSGMPAKDVTAAFDYYLKHYNNGRRFILAGHSQGSNALEFLLSGYMAEHPEAYGRMVAAYIIGFSVTDAYLKDNPHLKFAQSADDTGVIISYNTEKPGMTESSPVVLTGARAINPLNWKTDDTQAPAELNLGSLKVDARINLSRGTVACSTVNPDDYQLPPDIFPYGCYHQCDYSFYGENLRQNALERVKNMAAQSNGISGEGCTTGLAGGIVLIPLLTCRQLLKNKKRQ